MLNLDNITNKNNKKHSKKWPFIPDHPYRILIIGTSGSGKTNALLNLIKEQDDIDKIYLYAKDLSQPKYKFLIKKHKNVGIYHLNDPNVFTECSNRMDDVYQNIDENSSRKRKILIVFDAMITGIMSHKKFQVITKELFIRCRKLNISLSLIFLFQKMWNSTQLIMKIKNRKEFQNIPVNHSADINYNNFVRIYRECTRKTYSFLTINTTLPASDPL